MGKYKVLKSVAHNLGHSFTSLMNYRQDDYVMGHILTRARETGSSDLILDFVRKTAEPKTLNVGPIARSVKNYFERFPQLLRQEGSDPRYISSTKVHISYDLAVSRPVRGSPGLLESPYKCRVEIIDDRGKKYTAELTGWWYPQKIPRQKSPAALRLVLIIIVLLVLVALLFWIRSVK
jgi:hypothetical protein